MSQNVLVLFRITMSINPVIIDATLTNEPKYNLKQQLGQNRKEATLVVPLYRDSFLLAKSSEATEEPVTYKLEHSKNMLNYFCKGQKFKRDKFLSYLDHLWDMIPDSINVSKILVEGSDFNGDKLESDYDKVGGKDYNWLVGSTECYRKEFNNCKPAGETELNWGEDPVPAAVYFAREMMRNPELANKQYDPTLYSSNLTELDRESLETKITGIEFADLVEQVGINLKDVSSKGIVNQTLAAMLRSENRTLNQWLDLYGKKFNLEKEVDLRKRMVEKGILSPLCLKSLSAQDWSIRTL